MKKSTGPVIAIVFCVFVMGCSSASDKTEAPASEPPAVEPAPEPPPPPAPVEELAPPPKVDAPPVEPKKRAAAKNETKSSPKETTLSSGLKMIDSKEGQGDVVKTGNTISVHYTGWLYDNGKRGTKFDSSIDRGQPFVFRVGQGVIRGWSEGVVGMKPGGKRELIIPSDLAYGPAGAGGVIPPNATLDFEIELLQILR